MGRHILSGPETIRAVRKRQSDTILAFSCGKDAIARWHGRSPLGGQLMRCIARHQAAFGRFFVGRLV